MMSRRRLFLSARARWVATFAALTVGAVGPARSASPHLTDLTPVGAQRGTECELSLRGERLGDAQELLLYGTGIEVPQILSATNSLIKARLRIAPECRLGEHHLRVRTAAGLTELRTFFVGLFPTVEEREPNNEPAQAQVVALNATVTGTVTSEDVDCFRVEAKKGQLLSVEIEGMRLGRAAFDPWLAVKDDTGAVLAKCDDTVLAVQDPFISLVAPKDGVYLVQVRESAYGGADNCHYRLHLGGFPRPTSVYPLGGRTNELLTLRFFSEATGEFSRLQQLPGLAADKEPVFAETNGLSAPSPNWVRVSTFPNVLESPPNQTREQATAAGLPPPFALNGALSQPGESDWFRFPALKGQALDVAVYARRLRSPVDSVLEVLDAAGRVVAANDDANGADSAVRFTPAESTNYFVHLRDHLGQGGRDYTYRVEVTPVTPSLTLKIPEVARNDTQSRQFLAVPRGNRCATLIAARRADFGGELRFNLESPLAGLSLVAPVMPANVDAMPLVFECAPDAPVGGRLLNLTASWTNGSPPVVGAFRQEVELVYGPNNTVFYGTRVDGLSVAVTKEAPFKLRLVEPRVPLVQAGSMRLEVQAERAAGFEEPITLAMVWNPPGVNAQPEATIAKGATNAFYDLNASGGAQTRAWPVAILGRASVEGGPLYVSTQLASLEVAPPYLAGKIETLWLNPGKTGKLTVNLQQTKAFAGKAKLRLLGLPEKVTAPEREITKDDQEAVFEVTAAPQCPLGSHRNLFCYLEVPQDGLVIPHTIARGGILRIVPPRKEEPKVAAGPSQK